MKEKILETLRSLGFKLVQTDDENVYEFNYEGVSMLYMYNVSDEEFLSITVPCIMEVEEDNLMLVSALEYDRQKLCCGKKGARRTCLVVRMRCSRGTVSDISSQR